MYECVRCTHSFRNANAYRRYQIIARGYEFYSQVFITLYTFKEIIQLKQIYSYPKWTCIILFIEKILVENLHPIHFFQQEHREQRSAALTLSSSENQINFGHCNTKISYYKKYFLKKELNSASGKKNNLKKAYMESKTVMLINSVLMTTLILLYVKI